MANIYVGNLSYAATDDDLREAFGRFGEVTAVNIIMDRDSGRSRGFGFVEMADDAAANAAIEALHESEIAGRAVTVNLARRQERERDGGARGGDRW